MLTGSIFNRIVLAYSDNMIILIRSDGTEGPEQAREDHDQIYRSTKSSKKVNARSSKQIQPEKIWGGLSPAVNAIS